MDFHNGAMNYNWLEDSHIHVEKKTRPDSSVFYPHKISEQKSLAQMTWLDYLILSPAFLRP
jgi:hypothetical protein